MSKISVKTAAVKRPELIEEVSKRFGKERLVVAADGRRNPSMPSGFEVVTHGGTQNTEIDATEWAKKCERLGAGEHLPTSMDRDGSLSGYDSEYTRKMADAVNLPIIAAGGAGKLECCCRDIQAELGILS